MSADASTMPGLLHDRPDLSEDLLVEVGSPDDRLLEKILSDKVKLNFSYLPPRPIGPESLNIDPTKTPLVDPNKPPERIIYL